MVEPPEALVEKAAQVGVVAARAKAAGWLEAGQREVGA